MITGLPPVEASIIRIEGLPGGEYVCVDLQAQAVAERAVPGQFVHVRFPGRNEPFLRRPLSIAGAENGVITLLFKRKGMFTNELACRQPGESVSLLGPLGNGYDLSFPASQNAFLVAGGYGVAPMLYLARKLKEAGRAEGITLIEGARSREALVWIDRAEKIPWLEFVPVTEDGSKGEKGTALDALARLLAGHEGGPRLFACGPMGMLAEIHRRWPGIPYQAAVENQMGCGIGICQGCVLPVRGGEGAEKYARICLDGPVFPGDRIEWESCPE